MNVNQVTIETVLTALCLQQVGTATVRSWYYSDVRGQHGGASLDSLVKRIDGFPRAEKEKAQIKAHAILTDCARTGIWCTSIYDTCYPPLLRFIRDAPVVLFGKGNIDVLQKRFVGVVGTRKPSFLGRLFARDFVHYLCSHSIGVASGLALGVDSEAHNATLVNCGYTLAVLAGGVNNISPISNVPLADKIIQNGGAVLSEHLPNTIARRTEFVRRNRIISGISIASVLVESGVEGGSIHQARFTAQQRRPLFAFYPDMSWPHVDLFSRDGAMLLVDVLGATKIESRMDYVRVLTALDYGNNLPPHDSGQQLMF